MKSISSMNYATAEFSSNRSPPTPVTPVWSVSLQHSRNPNACIQKRRQGALLLELSVLKKGRCIEAKRHRFLSSRSILVPLKNVTSGDQFLSVIHIIAHKLNLHKTNSISYSCFHKTVQAERLFSDGTEQARNGVIKMAFFIWWHDFQATVGWDLQIYGTTKLIWKLLFKPYRNCI